MERSALIIGATGLTGAQLTEMLCKSGRYRAVTALVRKQMAYAHPCLHQKTVDFDRLPEEAIEPADDVFITIGTTIKKAGSKEAFRRVDLEYPVKIAEMAKHKGARHVLVISSMGANPESSAFYSRIKGQLELQLIDLGLPRLSIFRPSLLTGKRQEFRLGEQAAEKVLKGLSWAFVGPLEKYRPVPARTVAAAMLTEALTESDDPVSIFESDEIRHATVPETD